MLTREFNVPDPAAWRPVARELAAWIRPGQWAALEGPMGAGKTTFVQALVASMPGDPVGRIDVTSPTFALYHDYATVPPIRHYDLYRAGTDLALGATEALAGLDWQPENWQAIFVLVEWPDRLPVAVPPPLWTLSIRSAAEGSGRRALFRLRQD